MKYVIGLLLFFTSIAGATPQTALYLDLSQSREEIARSLQSEEARVKEHGLTLYAAPGTVVPLSITVTGPIANSKSEPVSLSFDRGIYLYLPSDSGEPMWSWDGRSWKPWSKLLTGKVDLGMGSPDEGFRLNMELKPR